LRQKWFWPSIAARRGDHGPGSRPGVVQRRQWRDRWYLRLAEQDARRLRGAAALVEQGERLRL